MNDFKHPNITAPKFILENYNDQLSPAEFGEKLIYEIQKAHNISLNKLAKKIGVSQQVLSNVRSGRSKRFTLDLFYKLYKFHTSNGIND